MNQNNISHIISLLGFARRANKILCGFNLSISAIQSNKAMLVIVASDASDRNKKQLSDKCLSHNTKLIYLPLDSNELSHIVGKSSSISVISILDNNFAKSIIDLTKEEQS